MEFHETKTVIMCSSKNKPKIYLNNKLVKIVDEYKYLGDNITINNKYNKLIQERKNSITGLVAELVSINNEIKEYSITASLQYLNGIIVPKLLINSETWNILTKNNITELEQIQSHSIKRLLRIPYTTPTRGLYNELGIMTIENKYKENNILPQNNAKKRRHAKQTNNDKANGNARSNLDKKM